MTVKVRIKKRLGAFALDVEFEGGNEVLALLGGSGCGKSMTLRCIAGIVTPDEGHIEVNGVVYFDSKKRVNMKPQQRRSGLLFQNYALFPNMTTKQNIMTVFEHGAGGAAAKDERYAEIARKFYLTGLDDHYPRQLSGGQQQRVAIARGIVNRAPILMADEPTGNLDSKTSDEIMALFRRLNDDGMTIILVTHEYDVASYAKRILHFRDGRIMKDEINERRREA
ncbi:MAG: ABC transporter ATP-binding protein [Cloacibacillus sp.]